MFKKVVAFFIIMVIILSVAPFSVCFAVNRTLAPTSLTDMQNKIYSFISENLNAHNTSFVLTLKGDYISNEADENDPYFKTETPFIRFKNTSGNDYTSTIFNTRSNPVFSVNKVTDEYFDADTYTQVKVITLTYKASYEETSAQTQAVINYAHETNERILNSSMSDYQKVKTIHDYLVSHFDYNPSNSAVNSTYDVINGAKYTCESFTALFYQLLKSAGIPSRIILKGPGAGFPPSSSKGINHSWNEVQINSNWYHIDISWDDSTGNPTSYFLKSSKTFSADHTWDQSVYPKSYSNYSSSGTTIKTTTRTTAHTNNQTTTKETTNNSTSATTTLQITQTTQTTIPESTLTQATSMEPTETTRAAIKTNNQAKKNNPTLIIIISAASLFSLAGIYLLLRIRK